MVFNNKKFGFTLAEVMLTLTLIGVLATLTISTIGSSVQQRARLSEFRAAYARLDAALRNVTIDEGKIYRCYFMPTAADKSEFGLTRITSKTTAESADCTNLEDALTKALGRTKTCASQPTTNRCLPNNYPADTEYYKKDAANTKAYILDNGMVLWLSTQGIRLFAVDINGRSAPNKWGHDIIPFMIKVTESKDIGDKAYPVSIGLLPPPTGPGQPAVTAAGMTTAELMKASSNKK